MTGPGDDARVERQVGSMVPPLHGTCARGCGTTATVDPAQIGDFFNQHRAGVGPFRSVPRAVNRFPGRDIEERIPSDDDQRPIAPHAAPRESGVPRSLLTGSPPLISTVRFDLAAVSTSSRISSESRARRCRHRPRADPVGVRRVRRDALGDVHQHVVVRTPRRRGRWRRSRRRRSAGSEDRLSAASRTRRSHTSLTCGSLANA